MLKSASVLLASDNPFQEIISERFLNCTTILNDIKYTLCIESVSLIAWLNLILKSAVLKKHVANQVVDPDL